MFFVHPLLIEHTVGEPSKLSTVNYLFGKPRVTVFAVCLLSLHSYFQTKLDIMPRRKSQKAVKIQIGDKLLTYGKDVEDMIDSNNLYQAGKFRKLREKLEREGYLFIRGVIPKKTILKARNMVLTQANKDGSILINDKAELNDARMFRKLTIYTQNNSLNPLNFTIISDFQ